MTLTTYPNLIQGTDEWLQARCGIVTASVVGKLLTPTLKVADNDTSRGLLRTLVAERITGHVEDTVRTPDMWRGVEMEPYAREIYAERYAHTPVHEMGFMVRDGIDGRRLGYSPDGLVAKDGAIEIKCPQPKEHVRVLLADEVPAGYMAQIQTGLLVSGRSWCDYVSYSGGLPLYVKRVKRDPAWREAIVAALAQFEENAAAMVAAYEVAATRYPATERIPELGEMEIA
ncbi:lambda exonuclease family protein [Luteipulveratus mongoliensis]|uniref:YqaJ viral recombinase domain-containing protein n=1 Tax=Luteipulveratus mongoliensis TaxID=571913 RepID=A0A0K1JGD5_9MICO|nr:lambda exonuclease family protein [Luteipulveratus mongoliensis]AKU15772.1 hypothetical protein VV02_07755 [Luteipulveratus mongoliensis]